MIEFLNLQKVNARFEAGFQEVFLKFLQNGQYILGEGLKRFEAEFASYCGTDYCVGVGNGLDALTLILKGYQHLGRLKPGDAVLVPANTFLASILAITNAGLVPVLMDANEDTFNSTLEDVKAAYTHKVKAVMVVHLYGQLADIEEIMNFANSYGLLVIEDAAQAHGASSASGKKAGSFGHAAAFSFYPTKNLGALGDGGAIVTNDGELFEVTLKLRNYGSKTKYLSELPGFNSRLDELQAMFLSIKLKKLDEDNEQRRNIARLYQNLISNKKIILPVCTINESHVYHLYVVKCEKRDAFRQYLLDNGIETLVHYPLAMHKQQAFANLETNILTKAEGLQQQIVSLPMSPVLSEAEIHQISEAINKF